MRDKGGKETRTPPGSANGKSQSDRGQVIGGKLLTQAQGQYAQWARKHLHRESLREVSRCRHAALDRLLLRPTETFAGDPDHCRMMDDSPNNPGVANAWDSSDARGAHEDRPPRGA